MSKSLNKVMLIGHAGGDPELKTFESEKKLATFSLATSESYKDKQGATQEKTTWHTIKAWEGLSKIVMDYVKKGGQLHIEGRIEYEAYEGKDNIKHNSAVIVAEEIILL